MKKNLEQTDLPSKRFFGMLPAVFIFFLFSSPFPPASAEEPNLPQIQTYEQLVTALRQRRDAQPNAGKASDREEIIGEAWDMGKMIQDYAAANRGDLQYKETLVKHLVRDLQIEADQLTQRMKFAKEYPEGPPKGPLSFSHYRMLLQLDDLEERAAVEKEAVEKDWDFRALAEEVSKRNAERRGHAADISKTGKIPEPARPASRVYQAVIGPQGKLALDLGLSNYYSPEGIEVFKENDAVVFENGKFILAEKGAEPGYFYRAAIPQVNDGDTFHAVLDLGFGFFTEQRVRLVWVNAPELDQPGGQEARAFLAGRVTRAKEIWVRAGKPDKFNRYLADLWLDGKYMNQELLDAGHAVLMEDQ